MTEPEFWKLIGDTKRSDPDEHVQRLIGKLATMPVPEILSFGHHWHAQHNAAYKWDLWGAAYLINGGCSDDGFIDFRSWLLLKGEDIYKASLEDADWLAKIEIDVDDASCECYPAPCAYEKATGTKDHSKYYDDLKAAFGEEPQSEDPSGDNWDFDDQKEIKRRLPNLYKKFGYS